MRLSALIAILLPAGSWAGSLVDSYPDTDLLGGDKYCYSGRAESQFRCPSDDEVRGGGRGERGGGFGNLYASRLRWVCSVRIYL